MGTVSDPHTSQMLRKRFDLKSMSVHARYQYNYVHSLLSETLPSLRGDPYASSDDDETYQPSDDSESYDSDDSGDD